MDKINHIHEKAQSTAKRYLHEEAALIDCLQEVDSYKVFLKKGYASLFEYATKALCLSESIAYSLIAIARKSRQVPELKTEIKKGNLTVSKAARIVSVITKENKEMWIEKSKVLPKRKLELEVAKVSPRPQVQERVQAVSGNRFKIQQGIDSKDFDKLKRVQDLLSQKLKKHINREEAIALALDFFLEKNDPVIKAKKQQKKISNTKTTLLGQSTNTRKPIPSSIKHLVQLRDKGQCVFIHPHTKERCANRRWIDLHHIVPISKGGSNKVSNLMILCKAHHQWHHQNPTFYKKEVDLMGG